MLPDPCFIKGHGEGVVHGKVLHQKFGASASHHAPESAFGSHERLCIEGIHIAWNAALVLGIDDLEAERLVVQQRVHGLEAGHKSALLCGNGVGLSVLGIEFIAEGPEGVLVASLFIALAVVCLRNKVGTDISWFVVFTGMPE